MIAFLNVKIFIGAVAVQKWCANAHLQHKLSQSLQKINGSSLSSKLTESYQSIIVVISYLLVVQKANVLLENCIKNSHVLKLGLHFTKPTLIVWEK